MIAIAGRSSHNRVEAGSGHGKVSGLLVPQGIPTSPVGASKPRGRWLATTAILSIATASLVTPIAARANPKGGSVVAGSATISQPSASLTSVYQQSNSAVINWQSFSINTGEVTRFYQPRSTSVILNRVVGPDPSVIAGHLVADGNVVLVNGAGIVFSGGSEVDVHSLIATPANISNSDFMAGSTNFNIAPRNPGATVVNNGTITVANDGLAALVAPGVANSGVIVARLGKVVLAGAETFTVDLYGDGLVSFDIGSKVTQVPTTIDGKNVTALVSNTGQISADGGYILLTADAVSNLVGDLVTAGGSITARSVSTASGTIIADAGSGMVSVTGTIDASGRNAGEMGGTINVLGNTVAVMPQAAINASGDGGGGTILIGGDFHGAGPQTNAKVAVVASGAVIRADALSRGNGGNIAVWAENQTGFFGSISARGGALGGNGGFVEVSSKGSLVFRGNVDVSAPVGRMGTILLDPYDITISNLTGDDTTLASQILYNDATTGTNANATFTATGLGGLSGAVILQASHDFTISDPVTFSAASSVSLEAGRNMVINATVSSTNLAPITFMAGQAFDSNGSAAGSIATTAAIGSATTGAITLTSGTGGISLGGNVTADGNITLNNAVTLSAASTIDSSWGNGDIALATVTGSGFGLTLKAGTGGLTLNGGATGLSYLDAAGTSGSITLDGNVTTGGVQSYGGPVGDWRE